MASESSTPKALLNKYFNILDIKTTNKTIKTSYKDLFLFHNSSNEELRARLGKISLNRFHLKGTIYDISNLNIYNKRLNGQQVNVDTDNGWKFMGRVLTSGVREVEFSSSG